MTERGCLFDNGPKFPNGQALLAVVVFLKLLILFHIDIASILWKHETKHYPILWTIPLIFRTWKKSAFSIKTNCNEKPTSVCARLCVYVLVLYSFHIPLQWRSGSMLWMKNWPNLLCRLDTLPTIYPPVKISPNPRALFENTWRHSSTLNSWKNKKSIGLNALLWPIR